MEGELELGARIWEEEDPRETPLLQHCDTLNQEQSQEPGAAGAEGWTEWQKGRDPTSK